MTKKAVTTQQLVIRVLVVVAVALCIGGGVLALISVDAHIPGVDASVSCGSVANSKVDEYSKSGLDMMSTTDKLVFGSDKAAACTDAMHSRQPLVYGFFGAAILLGLVAGTIAWSIRTPKAKTPPAVA
jgi:hypothetical protein